MSASKQQQQKRQWKRAVHVRVSLVTLIASYIYLHTCTVDHINIIYHTSAAAAGALSRKKTSIVSAA